jgi:hypothetical protein
VRGIAPAGCAALRPPAARHCARPQPSGTEPLPAAPAGCPAVPARRGHQSLAERFVDACELPGKAYPAHQEA